MGDGLLSAPVRSKGPGSSESPGKEFKQFACHGFQGRLSGLGPLVKIIEEDISESHSRRREHVGTEHLRNLAHCSLWPTTEPLRQTSFGRHAQRRWKS